MQYSPAIRIGLWLAGCAGSVAALAPGRAVDGRAETHDRVIESLFRMGYRDICPQGAYARTHFCRRECRLPRRTPTFWDLQAGSGIVRVTALPGSLGPTLRTDLALAVVGRNVELLGDPEEVEFVLNELDRERYNWPAVWTSLTVLGAAGLIARARPKNTDRRRDPPP